MRTVTALALAVVATGVSAVPHQVPFSRTAASSSRPVSSGWDLHTEQRLYRVYVNETDRQATRSMLEAEGLDVWTRSSSTPYIDFVAPSTFARIASSTAAGISSLNITTVLPSLAELIGAKPIPDTVSLKKGRRPDRGFDPSIHRQYHSYDGQTALLHMLASDYPDHADLIEIATTSEGRTVWGLKVRKPQGRGEGDDWMRKKRESKLYGSTMENDEKIGFVIAAGQHAREWISPSTVLYIAHAFLLTLGGRDSEYSDMRIHDLLEQFVFTFIPSVNPDGYAYTWEHDRLWKKNRQAVDVAGKECLGIDLNRNWGTQWTPAPRPELCGDSFPGTQAFEAEELKGMQRFLKSRGEEEERKVVFVDLHAYGQLLMWPYSYSCEETPPDEEDLFEAALGATKAVRLEHGRSYEAGQACSISYVAAGESIDWTYESGINWSFAIELRDQGVHGFILPSSEIIPVGEEMLQAIISLGEFIGKKEAGRHRRR